MAYKYIAFVILAAFYGCYFAKILCQRKNGVKTDRLGVGKGKNGFVKFIEIGVKLASILCLAVEIASIIFGGGSLLNGWVWRTAGACLAGVGATIFIISVITMRDSWRAGVPEEKETELVTNGVYKISRNPAFLGFDFVYVGVLLMFFNVPLLIATIAAGVMLHLQIVNVEEDFLCSQFGDEYLEYKKKVRRYFGWRREG